MNVNRVVISGRLTRDPETRKTPANKSLAKFSIASSSGKDKTGFFSVTAWGNLADAVSTYLKKGKQVIVDGRLDFQKWTGQDGKTQSRVSIVAESIEFVGSERRPESEESQPVDDDIPF